MPETIVHEATGAVLARRVSWARSFADKARGLIGRQRIAPGDALVIERASQVHTFGMSYPIDVLFCDADWRIVHCVRSLRPRRVTRWVRSARYVIELTAGAAASVETGDRIRIRAQPSER